MQTYATDADLEDAIARRNIAWSRMRDASDWLDATDPDAPDIRARRRDYNSCQDEYEHACRHLVQVRVWRQTPRAVA